TNHPDTTTPPAAAHTAWLLDRAGFYSHMFYDSGGFQGAIRLLERALQIRESLRSLDHPEIAATLNRLGLALNDWGRNAAARPVLERAIRLAEAGRGPDHPETGVALAHLGRVLIFLGEPTTALPLLERAVNITEASRGTMHPQTATALLALGLAFRG